MILVLANLIVDPQRRRPREKTEGGSEVLTLIFQTFCIPPNKHKETRTSDAPARSSENHDAGRKISSGSVENEGL